MKKKCICLCVVFSILIARGVYADSIILDYTDTSIQYGDVDGDEVITANDAAYIMQHVLMPILDEVAINKADVDGDGVITAGDAAYSLQKALNGSFIMPVEKGKSNAYFYKI